MSLGRGLNSLIPDKKTMAPLIVGLSAPAVARHAGSNEMAISLIDPNPYQPRKEFSEAALKSLAGSIAEHGVLQPIVVSPTDAGRYCLVVGERRLRAAKMAGLKTIPAIIRTTEDQDKLELALVENIQREDLNPLEEAIGYHQLKDEFGLSQAEIARRTGKSEVEILSRIRLLSLPDAVKEALVAGEITYARARALAQLTDQPDDLMKVWHESSKQGWSTPDLERAVVRLKKPGKRAGRKPMNPMLLEKQRELEEAFGTRVRLVHTNKQSAMTFTFFSDEEFFKAIERLLSLRDG